MLLCVMQCVLARGIGRAPVFNCTHRQTDTPGCAHAHSSTSVRAQTGHYVNDN